MGGIELGLVGKDWEESVRGLLVFWCFYLVIFVSVFRMYRVYGKKNVKLEFVLFKGVFLDSR